MNRRHFIKSSGLFVPAIFIPRLIRAQTILEAPGLVALKKKASGGGGGGGSGTYSLVSHTSANVASTGTATTSGANTTAANLIVVCISWFSGTPTLSDSKTNTWTALTSHNDGSSGIEFSRIYYCVNPTTDSAQTFSVHSTSAGYCILNVAWFTLSSGTPTFDVENGVSDGGAFVTSLHAGSVTPAGNNELFIASATWNNHGITATGIDSSFSILEQHEQGSNGISGGLAYLIQTSGSNVNPSWSFSGSGISAGAASIAVFK